mgnify:CR=1 FL=1
MNLIVFDLEWNIGYQPKTFLYHGTELTLRGEIIQIGAARINDRGDVLDTFEVNLKPHIFRKLQHHIAKVTGLSQGDLDAGLPMKEGLQKFLDWAGDDAELAEWGLDDVPVLKQNLFLVGLDENWPNRWYDLQRIFLQAYPRKEGEGLTLESVVDRLGIPKEEPFHNALDDALYTARVCRKLPLAEGLATYPTEEELLTEALLGAENTGRDVQLFMNRMEHDDYRSVPELYQARCPECGAPVVRDPDGAALRCTGAECPAQRLRNIAHFASREAMDIDGLGISLCQSLIEAGLVRSPAELYSLEPQAVAALDHMGKKSAENLIAAIEKSKDAGMARLLCAFGIRQVGQKAAKVLAMHFGTLDKLMAATEDELMAIPDVGPTTAAYLRAWFANPQSQHQIRLLRAAGVSFESREQIVDHRFAGKTFVLTGALEHFSRDEAGAIIERFGGKTSSSVSKKTSYLLAGENTGSKYQKALTLGTPIITEAEFLAMIQE